MTGMVVKLDVLLNPAVLLVALGVTLVAIIGKLVAGLAATRRTSRWLIGWSMVPRGEVGLIFATIGKSLGVVTDEVFSVIVIMVILTTFITPPALTFLIKRQPVSIPEEEEVLPRHADFYRRDASQILWESFESRFGKKPTRLLKQLRIRGIHWKIPTKR
jgi:hypothetical protein